MGNKKSKKGLVILLLLLAVVLMTIGFAAYTQTLTINGTVGVTASSWDVHYNPTTGVVPTANSTATATTATIGTGANGANTDFSFEVTLSEPGKVYEATIYPHNYGTITAYLNQITMSATNSTTPAANIDADLSDYFAYSIKYDTDTAITASTAANAYTGKSLAAGAEVPVVVRVEYVQPATADKLPANNQTITVTGSLVYSSED